MPIYEDNETVIAITNGTGSNGSQHINVRYHFLREQQWLMNIVMIQTSTHDQWADIMTKVLGKQKHCEGRDRFIYSEDNFDD
eukprot:1437664-Rhodomonas_salina.3